MDEMKINLGSKLMRKIVSKVASKFLSKAIGYKVKINFDELKVDFVDGDAKIRTNLEVEMDKNEFTKLIKRVEKDIDEMED